MTKDQQISCIEEAVRDHVKHLFDVMRLSILGQTDSEKIAVARLNFHKGIDEISYARDQAVTVINARGDL